MAKKRDFPDWDSYYKEGEVEKMPWFYDNLDQDVLDQIKSKEITKGKFLDLGTGPGTQCNYLTKMGISATGSDISPSAITRAKKLYPDAEFIVDDILHSRFSDNEFDFILDRGVFHIFEKEKLDDYLLQIKRILKKNGILFLKCMSVEEKNFNDGHGPYLYSKEMIREFFGDNFEIESIKDSVYYGILSPFPKALFAVMKNKK